MGPLLDAPGRSRLAAPQAADLWRSRSRRDWHLAPLPPGVPFEGQQFNSLMVERTGYFEVPHDEQVALARRIESAM